MVQVYTADQNKSNHANDSKSFRPFEMVVFSFYLWLGASVGVRGLLFVLFFPFSIRFQWLSLLFFYQSLLFRCLFSTSEVLVCMRACAYHFVCMCIYRVNVNSFSVDSFSDHSDDHCGEQMCVYLYVLCIVWCCRWSTTRTKKKTQEKKKKRPKLKRGSREREKTQIDSPNKPKKIEEQKERKHWNSTSTYVPLCVCLRLYSSLFCSSLRQILVLAHLKSWFRRSRLLCFTLLQLMVILFRFVQRFSLFFTLIGHKIFLAFISVYH